jgi:hypothetical protein
MTVFSLVSKAKLYREVIIVIIIMIVVVVIIIIIWKG